MSRLFCFVWVVLFFVSGCQQNQPELEPQAAKGSETRTQQITPSLTTTSPIYTATIIPSPTPIPLPTYTLTSRPSPTPTPSPTATTIITPIPTPSFLTERTPTLAHLEAYLYQAPFRIFDRYGDDPYEIFAGVEDAVKPFFFDYRTQLHYVDVNGDNEDDLLLLFADPFMWGWNYLFIMLWENTHYGQPLALFEYSKVPGGVAFTLDDWTGDGISEIIWDTITTTSGSGYYESTLWRHIIQCLQECQVVWVYPISTDWNSYSFYRGRGIRATDLSLQVSGPEIIAITEEFMLPFIIGGISSQLQVLTATKEVFTWTGTNFTLTQSEIVRPAYNIAATQILTAELPTNIAFIQTVHIPTSSTSWEYEAFLCTVVVDTLVLEQEFKCNPAFSQIRWHDVLADGQNEIIVTALFETQVRMLIWQRKGAGFHLIADVYGDVIRADLYGVRLENIDDDPGYEILAGEWGLPTDLFCFPYDTPGGSETRCWYEIVRQDKVFKWDGKQFIPMQDSQ
jgi:hypothetical protein